MDGADLEERATARVVEVANTMGGALTDLAVNLYQELAESIPELQGDQLMLDLLRASTESNVETFLHVAQYDVAVEEVDAPFAAAEYARRLAQRGTSSNALLRAYRLGQRRVVDWAFAEIAREEPDAKVAFAAAQIFQDATFAYIDRVSELVVAEYESEKERWLANRNTVRATMLASVLAGEDADLATAESALGYRLRQNHLGVVAWETDRDSSARELQRLENLMVGISEAIGRSGRPLFIPQDRSLGWVWIPLGRNTPVIDVEEITRLVEAGGPKIRLAFGTARPAGPGFRTTHLEALRAYRVATVAADRALVVTPYRDPGVQAAALLADDLETARTMVQGALGGLARDDDAAARLRDTLLTFLGEKGSYLATAEKVHLHKNTVKYRVDKAIEARGRPIDEDRFNLELALHASRWLGQAVLRPTE